MVRLQVKRGNEGQFLFDTAVAESIEKLTQEIIAIYNGRLKIFRICSEIEELANHGTMLPPDMVGLTDEQVEELKLVDCWGDKCIPSGGYDFNKDSLGRRNGKQPKKNIREVLQKAIEDANKLVDKKLINSDKTLVQKIIEEAMNILKGAVIIAYPMNLPPHDPIRMEFTNTEDLSGSQASLEVIEPSKAQLWFAGRQMLPDKCLQDYVGKNDKCKIVVKLTKFGEGPPGREPVLTEDARKQMMLNAYRRQEELKVSVNAILDYILINETKCG